MVNSRDQGIRLNRGTVVAITACVTGSGLFVLLAVNVVRENTHVTAAEELTVVLLLAIVVGIFGSCLVLLRHRLKAFFYILGAGVLFGFVAVLTRIISKQLFDPNGLFLLNVQWYSIIAIAAAGGLGSWFVQSAYASGPPDLVIAGLTVVDPMIGIAIGITILGELRPDVPAVVAICHGRGGFACYRGSHCAFKAPSRRRQTQERGEAGWTEGCRTGRTGSKGIRGQPAPDSSTVQAARRRRRREPPARAARREPAAEKPPGAISVTSTTVGASTMKPWQQAPDHPDRRGHLCRRRSTARPSSATGWPRA